MKIVKFFSILILSIAFVLQMAVIIPSGSRYCSDGQCGTYFWGAHEHDAVWHLAVSETLFHNFPFEMPNMSGTLMHGYNYLLDIVVAGLSFVTRISVSTWFFKLLPIAWFVCMSYLLYVFSSTYRKSKTFPLFVWFFAFFGSSFGFALRLMNTGNLWGSSSLLSMQSLQNMLNPQFAWSLIPLIALLIGLSRSKREYSDYIKYGIYTFIAIGLKFYTGAIMLLIIGADMLISLIVDRKNIEKIIIDGLIVASMTAISVLIFYSPDSSTGFPFIFKPLATVNPVIEDKSLFYLSKWAERLYSYNGIKLVILELGVLITFVVLNYGTRIFGLFGYLSKDELSNKRIKSLLIIGSIGSLAMSILLIQRGVWWNTVQFLYVSLFLTGILAAEGIDMLVRSKKVVAYLSVLVILILTIPTNIDVVHTFASFPGTAYIADAEMEALAKLKSQPYGVVLTPIFSQRTQIGMVPQLGNAYDTAYISAYSAKQTYLSDLIQLELTNVDYSNRIEMVSRRDCQVLEEVSYLYEYNEAQFANDFGSCGKKLERIFENKSVSVYQVKK